MVAIIGASTASDVKTVSSPDRPAAGRPDPGAGPHRLGDTPITTVSVHPDMDCPRCGTRLTWISLDGDLQSVYCEQCGFADVESDHTRASAAAETWDDALRRFRTANAVDESARTADTETERSDTDADRDTETEGSDTDADRDTETEGSDTDADRDTETEGSDTDADRDTGSPDGEQASDRGASLDGADATPHPQAAESDHSEDDDGAEEA
ncbi:hypothetical protein GCM10008995_00300 [Halobellus salinus]|uniref:Uncharacterized protein n=2 Tax=Halobellus salinus TaxID=931585 RepID=A0A830E6L7_9EURY|nr:hypothetical protein GCM10008995_00300 [Halobellus salinus]